MFTLNVYWINCILAIRSHSRFTKKYGHTLIEDNIE